MQNVGDGTEGQRFESLAVNQLDRRVDDRRPEGCVHEPCVDRTFFGTLFVITIDFIGSFGE